MAAPIPTWENLPVFQFFVLPQPITVTSATSTAIYTATNPPAQFIQPSYSIPDHVLPEDQQILTRVINALNRGLAAVPNLPPFPNSAQTFIQRHFRELATLNLQAENQVRNRSAYLFGATAEVVEAIFSAVAHNNVTILDNTPALRNSQRGDLDMSVIAVDPDHSTTVSVEFQTPEVFFGHGGNNGLQIPTRLDSQRPARDALAIAIKVSRPQATNGAC